MFLYQIKHLDKFESWQNVSHYKFERVEVQAVANTWKNYGKSRRPSMSVYLIYGTFMSYSAQ